MRFHYFDSIRKCALNIVSGVREGVPICLGLLLCTLLTAQEANLQIEHFSVDDGLTNPVIECLLQHSDGFVYVGTRNGLCRFDGYEFVVINTDSLSKGVNPVVWVTDLVELSDGTIFIGYKTECCGGAYLKSAALLDRGTGAVRRWPLTPENGFEGFFGGVATDNDQVYVCGIDSTSTHKYRVMSDLHLSKIFSQPLPRTFSTEELTELLGNTEYSAGFDIHKTSPSTGTYLVLEKINGLRKIDAEGHVQQQFDLNEISPNPSGTKRVNSVLDMIRDSLLVLGLSYYPVACEVLMYVDHEHRFIDWSQRLNNERCIKWYTDPQGNRIFCYRNIFTQELRTILYLNSGETIDLSGILKSVDSVTEFYGRDLSKMVFVLTQRGLIKISYTRNFFDTYMTADISPWDYHTRVRAIKRLDAHTLLISVDFEGVYILDEDSGEANLLSFFDPTTHTSVEMDYVWNVFPESDTTAWVSVTNGTFKYINIRQHTAVSYGNTGDVFGYATTKLHDARIFWGGEDRASGNALYRILDHVTRSMHELKFENSDATFLHSIPTFSLQSRDHSLWIGTRQGLYHVSLEEQRIMEAFTSETDIMSEGHSKYPKTSVLTAGHVMALCENSDSTLLIGLEFGGVNILNRNTGEVRSLTTAQGLANNSVCGIVADRSGIWFMTFRGLSYYDVNRERFRNFYTEDGLSHNEFNRLACYQDSNGTIYMGGMNGLNRFNPADLELDEDPAKLLVCEATYYTGGAASFDRRYFGLNSIHNFEIPSNSRRFSLKLALSDFEEPQGNTFAYLLEDMSQPGKFDETDWIATGAQREMTFDYLPPGRYTLHVKAFSANGTRAINDVQVVLDVADAFYKSTWFIIVCIALIFGLLLGVYRYRLVQALRLEKLRTQISGDLHDDVGGVLSGIAYQMELLEYSVDGSLKDLVHGIKEASRRAVLRMRDAVWAIDAGNDSYGDLEERMKRFVQEMLEPLSIEWTFHVHNLQDKQIIPSGVRHHLLLIFKEFITNSVKHASASKISIRLSRKNRWLYLSLQDNGTGMPETNASDGKGLASIKRRAEEMQARLEFVNNGGFGLKLAVKAF